MSRDDVVEPEMFLEERNNPVFSASLLDGEKRSAECVDDRKVVNGDAQEEIAGESSYLRLAVNVRVEEILGVASHALASPIRVGHDIDRRAGEGNEQQDRPDDRDD